MKKKGGGKAQRSEHKWQRTVLLLACPSSNASKSQPAAAALDLTAPVRGFDAAIPSFFFFVKFLFFDWCMLLLASFQCCFLNQF